MKSRGYLLLALFAYGYFLLSQWPARYAFELIETQVAPLELQGINGSIWSGEAASATWEGWRIERLTWQFAPLGLLLGQAGFDFQFGIDGQKPTGSGWVGFGGLDGLKLTGVTADLALDKTIRQLQLDLPAGISGEMSLTLEEVALAEAGIETLTGQALLHDVSVGPPLNRKLGQYRMDALTRGEGMDVVIRDLDSDILADLTLRLEWSGRYRLDGTLTPRDMSDRGLKNLLKVLGRPGKDQGVVLKLSGMFPGWEE
ncbi:MAG: type II secretion system protein N [Magnetococcales bacterium]|nr:type II secretion system protein N [Magnetococcales bacterium]